MKFTYEESMRKRKKYVIIYAILLILGVAALAKAYSDLGKFRYLIIGSCCFFGVLLIMQLFHIYELKTLKNRGVQFFDEESSEYNAEEEKRQEILSEDYEYGKNGEDLEFLFENGEYTYDTADDIFCPECGGSIDKDWIVCPACGENLVKEETEIEIEYCPNCGEEKNDEDDYCPKCGYAFDNNTNIDENDE